MGNLTQLFRGSMQLLWKEQKPSKLDDAVKTEKLADATETRLEGLPDELFHEIMGYLPLEACAALALTSKRAYQRWHACIESINNQVNPAPKRNFLRLLERDVPFLLLCNDCNRLYNWKTSPSGRCWGLHGRHYDCRPWDCATSCREMSR